MKNKTFPLILAAIATLSGCIPPLYHPSTINAPMFSKKGEVNVSGAYGKAGTDVQAAYSVSDNSGVMLNCSFGSKIQTDIDSGSALTSNLVEESNSSLGEYKHGYHFNFVEGGYGFYLKPKKRSDLRAEVFGLIGAGYAESFNELINYRAYGNYMRYSIQGNLGYVSKVTEGALSLRIGYLDFTGLNLNESANVSSNSGEAGSNQRNITNAKGGTSAFFIDPAVTFRVGYKGVKLFLQSGMSIPLSGPVNFGWDKSWGSIGLQFRISTAK